MRRLRIASPKADNWQKKGDLQSALAELEQGLQSYPDEQRAGKPRMARLRAQIRKEREAVAGELRRIDDSAKSAGQAAETRAVEDPRSRHRGREPGRTREIADLAAATIRVLEHRAKELRREHLRGVVAANRKRVLIVRRLRQGCCWLPSSPYRRCSGARRKFR